MGTTTTMMNRQVRLAARPVGLPKAADWTIGDEPLRELAEGEVRVRVTAISLDPAMRGWMNEGRSYIPPVGLGEVMRAGGVGVVEASRHPAWAVGEAVSGITGVQTHWTVAPDRDRGAGLARIDLRLGTPAQWLNVLGMPGMTAYFGLMDVGQPRPGETLVVSGAAGAVGQTVGQVAKIKGLRVVGIAGGPAKCAIVTGEFGFDACIDHKAGRIDEQLAQATPDGIDGCFENVGGPGLDAVLTRMNAFGRIAVCGLIAGYEGAPIPVHQFRAVLTSRLKVQGFIISEHPEFWPAALAELGAAVASGRLRYRESIVDGLASAPEALIGLLKGVEQGRRVGEGGLGLGGGLQEREEDSKEAGDHGDRLDAAAGGSFRVMLPPSRLQSSRAASAA
jgi:NADPH-dependent curcumin reductase CurA